MCVCVCVCVCVCARVCVCVCEEEGSETSILCVYTKFLVYFSPLLLQEKQEALLTDFFVNHSAQIRGRK